MIKISELLHRWAELEPDKCGKSEANPPGSDNYIWRLGLGYSLDNLALGTDFAYALVQYAVQEAITDRKWQWEAHGSRAYNSSVVKSIDINMKIKDGATVAESLLESYLAALESTKSAATDGMLIRGYGSSNLNE